MIAPPGRQHMDLGVMLSHTCDIACRHCCVEAGPQNRERLPIEHARDAIQQAVALRPLIANVIFTGGEVLLHERELRALLTMCREGGLGTRLVSNGSWARNPVRGRALLARLREAGLSMMTLSGDRWHLEFLPAELLRGAVALLREVKMPVVVTYAMSGAQDPVAGFCALYGFDPAEIRLLGVEGGAPSTASVEADAPIWLSAGPVTSMGRAAAWPDEACRRPLDAFADRGCAEVIQRPVIYPNGDLMACCSGGGPSEHLRVGNLSEAPLGVLFARMRARAALQLIHHGGPRALYEAVQAAHPERPPLQDCSSICELCVRAQDGLSHADLDAIAERALWSALMAGLEAA